jgi:Bacterial protein of unknown function (DUF922)
MHKLILILLLFPVSLAGQQLILPSVAGMNSHFYVSTVIDGRKDSLNNGSITISGVKNPALFSEGASVQIKKYTASLLVAENFKLPVVIRIKKLMLSDRVSGKSRIYKADMTLEFLRNDNELLTQLVELSTWMEQGASKNSNKSVQEKNISDIISRMIMQFEDLVVKQQNDPLFAPKIQFKISSGKANISENDTIIWTSNRKLTWNDFQGSPNSDYYAALSNCAFSQSIEPQRVQDTGVIYIYIRAALLKKGSWVQKDKANQDILNHEQIHFDIAEWHVRKLRKAISDAKLDLQNYEQVINRLTVIAWEEYSRTQKDYDAETEHGTIDKEQTKWNNLVAEKLKEFEDYR